MISPALPLSLCIQPETLAAGVKTAHDIEKSVCIVVTSGLVNRERFSKGLRESLEPRLRTVRSFRFKFWHASQRQCSLQYTRSGALNVAMAGDFAFSAAYSVAASSPGCAFCALFLTCYPGNNKGQMVKLDMEAALLSLPAGR